MLTGKSIMTALAIGALAGALGAMWTTVVANFDPAPLATSTAPVRAPGGR